MSHLEAPFLAEIMAWPADPGPRLVFADWLEEQDDHRGLLIRAQERLRVTPGAAQVAERDALARQVWHAQHKNLRQQLLKQASQREQLVLAAESVERILPVFEYHFATDLRPREAIEALVAYLHGDGDEATWRIAQQAAKPCILRGGDRTGQVVEAATSEDVLRMVTLAGRVGGAEERSWQLTRLVDLRLYGANFPNPT